MRVPAAVPSLVQSSLPWTPSSSREDELGAEHGEAEVGAVVGGVARDHELGQDHGSRRGAVGPPERAPGLIYVDVGEEIDGSLKGRQLRGISHRSPDAPG